MSHFYGVLGGKAGVATRCGSKRSGMDTVAASWFGAISVRLWHDPDTGLDHFMVEQVPWHGEGVSGVVASGVVGQSPKEKE